MAACLGFGQIVSTYSDLHDFGGTVTNANGMSGPDGSGPGFAGATFDSAGNMYGTTENGGANGTGMVWEITKTGSYKDLHDFGGVAVNAGGTSVPDGSYPIPGVIFDSFGNMYGTTEGGGLNEKDPNHQLGGIVWEITRAGKYLDLHDFGGEVVNANGTKGPDGAKPEAWVAFDSAGNMYGTTTFGGPNFGLFGEGYGYGMLWEITKAGKYLDLHDFGGTVLSAGGTNSPDGAEPGAGVAFDSLGNMFGTAKFGGAYMGGIVWEVTKSGAYQDLYDFGGTLVNADGTSSPDGEDPYAGVSFDSVGDIYGTASVGGASNGGLVWEITKSGSYKDLHDFGGTIANADGKSGLDGKAPYGGVTLDSEGNLYGTAEAGGPNAGIGYGAGNVWEITNTGFYRDLHDFGATSPVKDGIYPIAGVAFDSAGDLVGTASAGGPNSSVSDGGGMVWKLAITTVRLQSFTLTPNALIGGATSTGRIVLSNVAPAGGLLVTLSSNSSSATPPVSVTVPAGAGGTSFRMTTSAVAAAVSSTITATLGSSSLTASLAVHPAYVVGLSVSPTSVVGGARLTGTITLNGPAPAGGWGVRLSCSNASAHTPSYFVVPAGSTTATFPIATYAVTGNVSVTITATLNTFSKSAVLTVTP